MTRSIVIVSLTVLAACGGGGGKSADMAGLAGAGDMARGDGAAPSGWVFGGASGSGTFGGSTPTINLAATSTIAATVSFMVPGEDGAGTLTVTDALNHAMQTHAADVTPDTLPVDNANPSDGNPLLYFSFANPGPNSIGFLAASLTITPTPDSSFASFISGSSQCEFDTLDVSTMTWKSQGVSAEFMNPPPTSYSIANIVPSAGAINMPAGQTIGAVLCN